jgi:hypothetical protein
VIEYLHSEQSIIISVLVLVIQVCTESQGLYDGSLTIGINYMKRPPKIIKVYDSLPRNPQYPLQEFKLRVVKYHNSAALIDIREYVTSDLFTGYSPKGISLNREQLIYLSTQLHDILENMKESLKLSDKVRVISTNVETTQNEDHN